MDESRGDQGLLQLRWDSVADTKHYTEEHGCVGRGKRSVEGGGVASAQPGRELLKSRCRVGHIDAGCVQLEICTSLREVCAAIERRQVSRQHELPGCFELVAEAGLHRPAPTHHEVADINYLPIANQKHVGLDKNLGSVA